MPPGGDPLGCRVDELEEDVKALKASQYDLARKFDRLALEVRSARGEFAQANVAIMAGLTRLQEAVDGLRGGAE